MILTTFSDYTPQFIRLTERIKKISLNMFREMTLRAKTKQQIFRWDHYTCKRTAQQDDPIIFRYEKILSVALELDTRSLWVAYIQVCRFHKGAQDAKTQKSVLSRFESGLHKV